MIKAVLIFKPSERSNKANELVYPQSVIVTKTLTVWVKFVFDNPGWKCYMLSDH